MLLIYLSGKNVLIFLGLYNHVETQTLIWRWCYNTFEKTSQTQLMLLLCLLNHVLTNHCLFNSIHIKTPVYFIGFKGFA